MSSGFLWSTLEAELTVRGDGVVEEDQPAGQLPIVQHLLMVLAGGPGDREPVRSYYQNPIAHNHEVCDSKKKNN